MNDTTSTPQNDDWLLPVDTGDGSWAYDPAGWSPVSPRRRQWLTSGGLLAAGAAVGVVIALGVGHNGSSGSTGFTPTSSLSDVQPPPPAAGAFPHGDDGGGDD